MKPIHIDPIPHKMQRYETSGDYLDCKGVSQVFVSKLPDDRYEFCVAIHEAVEQFLCRYRGIQEEDITEFDVQFEAERKVGIHDKDAEPGDAENAPYRREHFFATNIERQIAAELEVDWSEYERALDNLYNSKTIRRKVK